MIEIPFQEIVPFKSGRLLKGICAVVKYVGSRLGKKP